MQLLFIGGVRAVPFSSHCSSLSLHCMGPVGEKLQESCTQVLPSAMHLTVLIDLGAVGALVVVIPDTPVVVTVIHIHVVVVVVVVVATGPTAVEPVVVVTRIIHVVIAAADAAGITDHGGVVVVVAAAVVVCVSQHDRYRLASCHSRIMLGRGSTISIGILLSRLVGVAMDSVGFHPQQGV